MNKQQNNFPKEKKKKKKKKKKIKLIWEQINKR